jgi:ethanolamine utilization microcompartment shell protein EutS
MQGIVTVVETDRLRLREFVPGDVDALAAVIRSRETELELNHGSNATGDAIGTTVRGFGPWF